MPRRKQSGLFAPLSGLRSQESENPPVFEQLFKKSPRKYTKRTKAPKKIEKLLDLIPPKPIVPIVEEKIIEEEDIEIFEEEIQIEIELEDHYEMPEEPVKESIVNTIEKIQTQQEVQEPKRLLKIVEKEEKTQRGNKKNKSPLLKAKPTDISSKIAIIKKKRGRPKKAPISKETLNGVESEKEESICKFVKTPQKPQGRKPKSLKVIEEDIEKSNSESQLSSSSKEEKSGKIESEEEDSPIKTIEKPQKQNGRKAKSLKGIEDSEESKSESGLASPSSEMKSKRKESENEEDSPIKPIEKPQKRGGKKLKSLKKIKDNEKSKSKSRLSSPGRMESEEEEESIVKPIQKRRGKKPKDLKAIEDSESQFSTPSSEEKSRKRKSLVIRPTLSKMRITKIASMVQEGQNASGKRKRTKSIDIESEKLTKSTPEKKIKRDRNFEKDLSDSVSVFSELSTKKSDDYSTPSEYPLSDDSLVAKIATTTRKGRQKKSKFQKITDSKSTRPKRACRVT